MQDIVWNTLSSAVMNALGGFQSILAAHDLISIHFYDFTVRHACAQLTEYGLL